MQPQPPAALPSATHMQKASGKSNEKKNEMKLRRLSKQASEWVFFLDMKIGLL